MIVNGQAQQHIAIADRAVQYGDGCFTTIAYKNGYLECLDAHVQRLKIACERLHIDFVKWAAVKQSVIGSVESKNDCVVKIIITRGQGGRGYSTEGVHSSSYIVTHHVYPSHYSQWKKDGIKLIHSPIQLARQPILAGIKHLNRLEQVLVKHELATTAFNDAVVCDTENNIIESSVGNLFWFKNNSWFTPKLDFAGVEGVMRNLLLSIMRNNKIYQQEVISQFDALAEAEEVFICNSLMGVVPVVSILDPASNQAIDYQSHQSKQLQALLETHIINEANRV